MAFYKTGLIQIAGSGLEVKLVEDRTPPRDVGGILLSLKNKVNRKLFLPEHMTKGRAMPLQLDLRFFR